MRFAWIGAAAVWVGLGAGGAARAGLYNTAEQMPPVAPTATVPDFQATLGGLWSIKVEQPESLLRKRYVLAAKVDPRARGVNLTVEQRVDLSAYLIRLGRVEDALDVLRPAEAQDRRNPLVLANLGTANLLLGNYERAVSYLGQAYDNWPRKLPGLEEVQLERLREAEKYQGKLARGRARTLLRAPPGARQQQPGLDNLFDVRFVGESGQYEAGKLAADQKAKLPPNALGIVEQLLVWMPDDRALYWLYGEVLNAQGQVREARDVLEMLCNQFRYDPPELKEHRQVLNEAVEQMKAAATDTRDRTGTAAPAPARPRGPMTSQLAAAGVGALAGAVVTALLFLQVREVRRRQAAGGRRG